MANNSVFDLKFNSQLDQPVDSYNLQAILDRRTSGTDPTPVPANTTDAITRRLSGITDVGTAQNLQASSTAATKQLNTQESTAAAAYKKYQDAVSTGQQQAIAGKQALLNVSPTGVLIPNASAVSSNAIVAKASTLAGIPYKWGGITTKGFDCSGLVQYVYKSMGINLPRTSQQQATMGTKTSINNLKPGDLVAWGRSPGTATHIAIYAGNGKIWESPHTGAKVRTRAISTSEPGIMGIALNLKGK